MRGARGRSARGRAAAGPPPPPRAANKLERADVWGGPVGLPGPLVFRLLLAPCSFFLGGRRACAASRGPSPAAAAAAAARNSLHAATGPHSQLSQAGVTACRAPRGAAIPGFSPASGARRKK